MAPWRRIPFSIPCGPTVSKAFMARAISDHLRNRHTKLCYKNDIFRWTYSNHWGSRTHSILHTLHIISDNIRYDMHDKERWLLGCQYLQFTNCIEKTPVVPQTWSSIPLCLVPQGSHHILYGHPTRFSLQAQCISGGTCTRPLQHHGGSVLCPWCIMNQPAAMTQASLRRRGWLYSIWCSCMFLGPMTCHTVDLLTSTCWFILLVD